LILLISSLGPMQKTMKANGMRPIVS